MKQKPFLSIPARCLIGLSVIACPASAAIIASTSFGGSAGSPTGDVGFSSSIWASTAGGVTNSTATFTAGNITSLPTSYTTSGFVNTGNFLQTANSPAFRTLSSAIGNESVSTTYFSFLYRVASSQTNATQGGGLSFYSGTTERAQIGLGLNQSVRINDAVANVSPATSTSNSFITGTDTAWIVGKFETGFGNDTFSLNVYTGTEMIGSEPVIWEVSKSWALGGNIDTIRFNSGATLTQQFDEFRMGTTFADVIPEPSSYAIFSGLLAFGLLNRRRRP